MSFELRGGDPVRMTRCPSSPAHRQTIDGFLKNNRTRFSTCTAAFTRRFTRVQVAKVVQGPPTPSRIHLRSWSRRYGPWGRAGSSARGFAGRQSCNGWWRLSTLLISVPAILSVLSIFVEMLGTHDVHKEVLRPCFFKKAADRFAASRSWYLRMKVIIC